MNLGFTAANKRAGAFAPMLEWRHSHQMRSEADYNE